MMDLSKLNKDRKQRRKEPTVDLSTMVYGKVPPNHKGFERAVLGACMLERGAFELASEQVKADHFYQDAHQRIFSAMASLKARNAPIDIETTIAELDAKSDLDSVGGPHYVVQLTNDVVSSGNIEYHASQISGAFVLREVLRICGETIGEAYESDSKADTCLAGLEKRLTDLTVSVTGGAEIKNISVPVMDVFNNILKLQNLPSHITGVASGFDDIDNITHGWQNSDLIILAARPSVGKTAFSLACARAAANQVPVGYISLEMSAMQLVQRVLSAESQVPLDKIKTGRMGVNEVDFDVQLEHFHRTGIQKIGTLPFFIYDEGDSSWTKIRSVIRKMVRKHGVKKIIIDYLQLMSLGAGGGRGGNRELEISTISRECKMLAKELNIPILLLSQLSREVEKRASPKPQLSDLRESGAIEQDADMVIFLYAPTEMEIQEKQELEYFRFYKIAKNRNGSLDSGGIAWFPEIQLMQGKEKTAPQYALNKYGSGDSWRPVEPVNNEPKRSSFDDSDDMPF